MPTSGNLSLALLVGTALALSAARVLAGGPDIEAEIPRRGAATEIGFGYLWLMSGAKLVRINTEDNSHEVFPVQGASGSYRSVATGEDAVWVPDVIADTIYKFDPQTAAEITRCPAPMDDSMGSIAVGDRAVWVVTTEDEGKTLARIDASTCQVAARIPLPANGKGVVADYGSVWVTGYLANEIYRIDPTTNTVVDVIPLRKRPRFATSFADSVWVLNEGDSSVQRIDGKSGKVIATIEGAADGVTDIVGGGGYVWVMSNPGNLAKIDPGTNKVVKLFDFTGMGDTLRFASGSLWVSGPQTFRVKPPD